MKWSELERYLDDPADDLTMADTVLNSKLSAAEQKQIRLNVRTHIPKGLSMSDVELCSVLGNLLDNAAETCEKLLSETRFLCVYIDKTKGQFYLSVQNSTGSVHKERGVFRSGKQENHGFGLFRIDRIAKKHGSHFQTEVSLTFFADNAII